MLKQHNQAVSQGKIGAIDILVARDGIHLPQESDIFIEAQLKSNSS